MLARGLDLDNLDLGLDSGLRQKHEDVSGLDTSTAASTVVLSRST
jgi:hypothetical protein